MNRIVLFLTISVLFSCTSQKKVDLKINRFEQILFEINIDNVAELTKRLRSDFGTFDEVFAAQIIQKGRLTDAEYQNELLAFTQHNDMREAYDSVALLFADFSEIEEELEFAFGQFSVDFPSYPIPQITTFFGGFNYGVVTYDDNIAIGLENFLGESSKYYALLGDPSYLRFQKQRKFITCNVMEVWLNEYFQQYLGGIDLLSQLIYRGKIMYCIDKMLPESAMRDKFRFTKLQMDWVEENEKSIWQYIVHQDLLFSTKEQDFRSFINYAPFAKGMPPEAPGRVAYYIGYRMVSEFMDNNEIDIEELMYLTDSRWFLKQSKYKPTK
ncbi:hypothetical protein OAK24_00475 [Flavobacteriales bacterium]|nr:hypothetical protein [Flavobacteriales bacterium]